MFEFKLPDLGEGIHEGELIKWYVKEKDTIKEDDPLCDVETDKATVTIPSPRTGTIAQLNAQAGDTITVGSILVIIDENKNRTEQPIEKETAPVQMPVDSPVRQKAIAAPATRRLAREMGIDINQVPGTGAGGKVTKEDLNRFSDTTPMDSEPAPASEKKVPFEQGNEADKRTPGFEPGGIPFLDVLPMPDFEAQGPVQKQAVRSLRKKTAIKTTSSMILVPHVAHMDECDVTEFEKFRKSYNDTGKSENKLTLMVFAIKAAASLLKQFPAFNASLDPVKMEIIYKQFYHIGFAADTPKGLMVPVIKDADGRTVIELSQQVGDLAQKAREGTIALSELSNGTFTITNVGAIGGTGVVPTINYPESAILGMGRVAKKPVVRDDEIVIRKILPITLCFDHRIADGVQAALFVNQFRQMMEDPYAFMTGI